jgi:hypothetical protein
MKDGRPSCPLSQRVMINISGHQALSSGSLCERGGIRPCCRALSHHLNSVYLDMVWTAPVPRVGGHSGRNMWDNFVSTTVTRFGMLENCSGSQSPSKDTSSALWHVVLFRSLGTCIDVITCVQEMVEDIVNVSCMQACLNCKNARV